MKKLILSFLIILAVSGVAFGATYNIGPGQTYTTFALLIATETLAADDIVDGGGNTFTESWLPDGSGSDGHPIILRNATISSIFPNGQTYIELQNIELIDGGQIGTNWTVKNLKGGWQP